MWLVRAFGRLIVQTVLISIITIVIALVLAAVSAGSFHSDARVLAIVFGCMLLAMGGVGRGSNLERFSDQGVMQQVWGTIPGFNAMKSHPEEPRLNPGIVLFVSGLVLVALGVTIL